MNKQTKETILLNQTGVRDPKNLRDNVLRPHMPVGKVHPNYASSGVTIGAGIDLGNRTAQQIRKEFGNILSKEQVQILKAGAGLKGEAAQKWVNNNKSQIKISPEQVQKMFDAQLREKDKLLQEIFGRPIFQKKFGVKGKELLAKMEQGYKTVMYDTLYLGRNTVETRGYMIPYLVKIHNGTATEKDRQDLNTTIKEVYTGHTQRQQNISSVIGGKNKSNSNKENDHKSMNEMKNNKGDGLKPNTNLGGVDLSYIIQQKHFNGFSLSKDYMQMHVSGGNNPSLKDMIVPLKIFYDSNIKNKNVSISIDPHVPTDPNGPQYEKIYYPAEMVGTQFAQVMIQADYIMKELKMGVNRKNQPFSYPESLKKVGIDFNSLIEYITNPNQRTRQWIVIRDVEFLKLSADRVQIGEVKMGIEARVQNIGPTGKLVDSEAKPSLHTQKFCELFTKYYDLIAKEYEEFNILKRLAKATVIAQIMRRQGSRIDQDLINTLFERQKTDKSSKIIPRMSHTMDLNPKQTPRINLQGDIIKLNTTGGCQLNFNVDDKKLETLYTAESDQDAEQDLVPFLFQDMKVCDEQNCNNFCSNGYRSIKDTRCSEHTKFICSFCFTLMKQGEQYLQLSDERLAHKECLKCEGCYQSITGEQVTFQSLLYHRNCVPKISVGQCYICKEDVDQTQQHFITNKGFLHEKCSHIFKCKKCEKNVDLNSMRSINEDNYHKDCVICGVCSNPISEDKILNYNNKFAHVACVPKQICKGCNQNITSTALTLGSDMYHQECFKCHKCKNQLSGQIRTDGKGSFYHPACAV